MADNFEHYDALARKAELDASATDLANVRERCLRAAKTWRQLADHARRVSDAKQVREDAARDRRLDTVPE